MTNQINTVDSCSTSVVARRQGRSRKPLEPCASVSRSSTLDDNSTRSVPKGCQSGLMARMSKELEAMRDGTSRGDVGFPLSCRQMLLSLPGNSHCVDCGNPRPEWASVSYGVLLCLQCSGRHRSYGVQTSRVINVEMDTWSHTQVLSMLEGGNDQLQQFFRRHRMDEMVDQRYQTKAALFYRTNLKKHVTHVAKAGPYKGREAARRKYQAKEAKKIVAKMEKENTMPDAKAFKVVSDAEMLRAGQKFAYV